MEGVWVVRWRGVWVVRWEEDLKLGVKGWCEGRDLD